MKARFYCDRGSSSLMRLIKDLRANNVDALRIKKRGSAYTYPSSHLVVNWGCTSIPPVANNVLNSALGVSTASQKIKTFEALAEAGVPALPFTTRREEAMEWITQEDSVVFARKLTQASQGKGIVVAHAPEDLVGAPLYTQHVEAAREVRVHVFKGEVIDFTQKRKLSTEKRSERGFEGEPDEYVRNLKGGWIFARVGVEIPESAKEVAIEAVEALGLDFGAVDMFIDPDVVIEVNSAPGLEGTTLERYVDAFTRYLS